MPKARSTAAEFVAAWNAAASVEEVARQFGVSRSAVLNRAARLRVDGVPLSYMCGRNPEALRRLRDIALGFACPHCGKAYDAR